MRQSARSLDAETGYSPVRNDVGVTDSGVVVLCAQWGVGECPGVELDDRAAVRVPNRIAVTPAARRQETSASLHGARCRTTAP